jgi:hypothetical protein
MQTAFESWLIAASSEFGIPSEQLSKTFAKSTFINGIAAISSGVPHHKDMARKLWSRKVPISMERINIYLTKRPWVCDIYNYSNLL